MIEQAPKVEGRPQAQGLYYFKPQAFQRSHEVFLMEVFVVREDAPVLHGEITVKLWAGVNDRELPGDRYRRLDRWVGEWWGPLPMWPIA